MHIEFIVEEASAEAALNNLVPKILGNDVTFQIHPHQGKHDLFSKLSGRLKGYAAWLPDDWRIVVLVDRDNDDCLDTKSQLDTAAKNAGLIPKSVATSDAFHVLNRIAIEELEAWFFGDVGALHAAYGVSPHLAAQAPYQDPDNIAGGTWEALKRELQCVGHFTTGLRKIEAARTIASHMDPARNRSKSFQVFRDGLLELIS